MNIFKSATITCLLFITIFVLKKAEAFDINSQIKSHKVTDKISINVYVPESKTNNKLPTVYLMDGQYYLYSAIGLQKSLNHRNKTLPNFIVVSIDTAQLPEPSTLRFHLLNSKADEMKATLLNKIVPLVEANYPTNDMKIYFGWEHAAGFGLELFNNNSIFNGFLLASSPNYSKERIDKFQRLLQRSNDLNRDMYITLGHRESHAINEHKKLASIVEQLPKDNFEFKFNLTESYSHFTTPIDALVNGLIWHFSDFKEVNFYSIDEVVKFGGVEGVIRYYKVRSAKYQVPYAIPENTKFTMARHAVDSDNKNLLDEVIEKLGSFDTGGAYWGYYFAKFAFKHKDYDLAEKLIMSSTQIENPSYRLLTLKGDIRVIQNKPKNARKLYFEALEATNSKEVKKIIQTKIDAVNEGKSS